MAPLLNGGCQDTDVPGSQRPEEVPIELRVAAPGLSAWTKAESSASLQTTVFCSTREGDYAALGQDASGKWKAYEWAQATDVTGSDEVTLTDKYYPPYGDNVYLVAVSPQIEDTDADGTLSYTLTGKEDLMYAPEISGNRWEVSRLGTLTYHHLLTQLVFKARKREAGGLDVTVRKITVKDVTATVTIPLATGEATFAGSGTPSANLSDITLDLQGGKKVEASQTEAIDLGCLYLPPFTQASGAKITVETSIGTFTDVSITMGGAKEADNFAAGVSHVITIDISDQSLGISSVEVAAWNPSYVDGNLDLVH